MLKGGEWHSSAYQRYLDLGREEPQAAADILILNAMLQGTDTHLKNEERNDRKQAPVSLKGL